MADNPFVTVDVHDVVNRQFFHVDERQGCEADKDEDERQSPRLPLHILCNQ
jgi:hypothetical protein